MKADELSEVEVQIKPSRADSVDMIVLDAGTVFDGVPYPRNRFLLLTVGGVPLRRTGLTRTVHGTECEVLTVDTDREMAFAVRDVAKAILQLVNVMRDIRAELFISRNPIDTKRES